MTDLLLAAAAISTNFFLFLKFPCQRVSCLNPTNVMDLVLFFAFVCGPFFACLRCQIVKNLAPAQALFQGSGLRGTALRPLFWTAIISPGRYQLPGESQGHLALCSF